MSQGDMFEPTTAPRSSLSGPEAQQDCCLCVAAVPWGISRDIEARLEPAQTPVTLAVCSGSRDGSRGMAHTSLPAIYAWEFEKDHRELKVRRHQ
jgi:hypothetical protein